jgi:putative toxin-antitoxin system antitoxin component (TIGR02293 family)
MATTAQTWRRLSDEFAPTARTRGTKPAAPTPPGTKPPAPKPPQVNEQAFEYGGTWLDHAQERVRQAAMAGAPFEVAERIKARLHWSDESLAKFIRLSVKTLQRHRANGNPLGPDAAEKIVELAELFALGGSTFGDTERFLGWLQLPNLALGEATPESLLFDAMGRRLLKEEIARIEFGVWA